MPNIAGDRQYGGVLAGLWMSSPEEAAMMERAMETRLRSIGHDHPDRPKIEKWRSEAMNLLHRATRDGWRGWAE